MFTLTAANLSGAAFSPQCPSRIISAVGPRAAKRGIAANWLRRGRFDCEKRIFSYNIFYLPDVCSDALRVTLNPSFETTLRHNSRFNCNPGCRRSRLALICARQKN